MKIKEPRNPNYAAVITKIKVIHPLAGCDNIVGTPLFGFQSIVSKDTEVGTLGVVFTAETQLSEAFVKFNNLYRHNTYNLDQTKTGYLEDNRRIRAIQLRKHRSDALFLPLESLSFTGDISELKEGDAFDELNGVQVCNKYVVPSKGGERRTPKDSAVKFTRVEPKFFPEHFDSSMYYRVADSLDPETNVIVSQKLHGTSIRVGKTIVKRNLTLLERIVKKLGAKVQETEYDAIYGSRKVIKDTRNSSQKSFYGIDIWSVEGEKIESCLPNGYLLFGELIGWTPTGAPIQKNYTYDIAEKECKLYVYRIATINDQGVIIDLAWDQLVEFCNNNGLEPVRELWRGKLKNFVVEDWLDKDYVKLGFNAVPLSSTSPCDEGVCIRIDGIKPEILKAKSSEFYRMESALLDNNEIDIESNN